MFQRFPIGKVMTNNNQVFDVVYICDTKTGIAWVDFMRGNKCTLSTRADVFDQMLKDGIYCDYTTRNASV